MSKSVVVEPTITSLLVVTGKRMSMSSFVKALVRYFIRFHKWEGVGNAVASGVSIEHDYSEK